MDLVGVGAWSGCATNDTGSPAWVLILPLDSTGDRIIALLRMGLVGHSASIENGIRRAQQARAWRCPKEAVS